jgi:hypothetical protein
VAMSGAGRAAKKRHEMRPPGLSELRLRVGGIEIAVAGTSREDCLRQLEAAAQEVDAAARRAETRWGLTAAGRRAVGEVA